MHEVFAALGVERRGTACTTALNTVTKSNKKGAQHQYNASSVGKITSYPSAQSAKNQTSTSTPC